MQELQVKHTEAKVEIIDKEAFEKNINEIVTKYKGYTVTAGTIKDDKRVLASLRKLVKQISDKRIEIKKELTAPVTDFEKYVKRAVDPLNTVISSIDADVKAYEEHQQMLKTDTVKAYISNKASEVLLDPRIFAEKVQEYTKVGDFMADGVTLKKVTMKSLDDLISFELQKQEERKQSEATIAGQCAEYGMDDFPYMRMLKDMTVIEVLGQIKSDYSLKMQKLELERAEAERKRQTESQNKPHIDAETGEILDGGQIIKEIQKEPTGAKIEPKTYKQKMTLEVFFENSEDKDQFKRALSEGGYNYQKNYWISGYQNIAPVTQEELESKFK